MITKLILTNFKGIKQGEVPLSPLTLLVGTNNAGKTTILEALFLAPNPIRQVPYGDFAVSIVRKLHATLDSSGFAFLMLDYRGKQASVQCQINGESYSVEFWVQGNQILLTSNKQNPNKSGYPFDVNGKRQQAFGSLGMRDNNFNAFDPGTFIGDSLLINPSLIASGYNFLRNNWASIMNSGVGRQITKEVSELSPEKYSDLTLEPFFENTYALYAFRNDGKRIRLGDLGEGIQTYILARILYEIQQPDLLLWDDVESHFNPKILVKLSEWFSELIAKGKQVVLATHSLEAVRLITEYNKDKASILLTSLNNNILNTRALSLDEIEEFRQAGIDVRIAESFLV